MKLSLTLNTATAFQKRLNQFAVELKSELHRNVYTDPDDFEQLQANYLTGSFDGDFTLYSIALATLARLDRKIKEGPDCFVFELDDEIHDRVSECKQ